MPKALFAPAKVPFTLQETLEFVVPVTVVVKGCVTGHCVVLMFKDAIAGVTATPMVMVMLAEADFVVSAWAIAITLTFGGEGKIAGAMYRPALSIVPQAVLPPVVPFTCQVTAWLTVP
jgi:hypothetical protein